MPEFDFSPYDCGGNALADSAHNLVRTLRTAPSDESARAAALRRGLLSTALLLAENWSREPKPIESARSFNYHRALWKLRDLAVELAPHTGTAESGLRVVMETFCRQFLPDTLVALRPTGLATFAAREQIETLEERLCELGIDRVERESTAPKHLLVVRFPQGEQDNTLMACCVLPHFNLTGKRHIFATAAAGPAYFFARAAEIQNNKGFNEAYDRPTLCFIGELLQISGWLEHPQIGPLIDRWSVHFGFGPNYLDQKILNEPMLRKMREAQEQYRVTPPDYTPEDFDRAVPTMWEQLREARPPVGPLAKEHNVTDVLNAGWSFAQLHLDDLYTALRSHTPEERCSARHHLNRLLAKAIERTRA